MASPLISRIFWSLLSLGLKEMFNRVLARKLYPGFGAITSKKFKDYAVVDLAGGSPKEGSKESGDAYKGRPAVGP